TICTPTTARISVDLPQPLGPSRPVTRPGEIESERSRMTSRPPRTTRSCSISIAVTPASVSSRQLAAIGVRRVTLRDVAGTGQTGVVSTLAPEELKLLDAYWRAANYLSVGQIYLLDNPLLREPLRPEHVKPRLL